MNKDDLNTKLKEQFHSMENDLITGKIKNLPRVISACSASLQDPNYQWGCNHSAKQSDYDQRFLDRIEEVFPGKSVGERSGLTPWPIGQCAEQHAANKVLKNDANAVIEDLQFSDAIKTKMPDLPFPPCANCKTIFDQLQ